MADSDLLSTASTGLKNSAAVSLVVTFGEGIAQSEDRIENQEKLGKN